MAAGGVDLEQLRARLTRLGVEVRGGAAGPLSPPPAAPSAARSPAPKQHAARGETPVADRGKKGVAELFERISRVERAMTSAEAQSAAIQQALQEEPGTAPSAAAAGDEAVTRSPQPAARKKSGKAGGVSKSAARAAALLPGQAKGLGVAVRSAEHMRAIPAHTPLSTVLAQFKEAEAAWAHEKARLRREALEERKRANRLELEHRRQARMLEHGALDAQALKTALKARDAQLSTTAERVRELEVALARTQEESALTIASLNAERDDLKALLTAALSRLEAVDDLVQRADISSAVMEDKMRQLEDERTRALDAAARARIEVNELAESRRKLQWQSKLLEKMSEVQLKHNKRKSAAIRRLLSVDGGEGGAAAVAAAGLDGLDDDEDDEL